MRFLISLSLAAFLIVLSVGCAAHVGPDGMDVSFRPAPVVYAPPAAYYPPPVPAYAATPCPSGYAIPWRQPVCVLPPRPQFQPTSVYQGYLGNQYREPRYYGSLGQQLGEYQERDQQWHEGSSRDTGKRREQAPKKQQPAHPHNSLPKQQAIVSSEQPEGFGLPGNNVMPGAPTPSTLLGEMHLH